MGGKLLTPGDLPQVGAPNEMNVMVNVNNSPAPLPVARLLILNEIASNLARIADALEGKAAADA
jgi:hypothetical protein